MEIAHMSHNWIEFIDPAPVGREELYVSLNPQGRMVMGRKTVAALGEPQHVVLLFDPDTDSIGVRRAASQVVNAFRMQPNGKRGSYLISIRRFVRKHDIRLDHTVRFPMAHIDNAVLVLDLHTRVPAEIR